MRFELDLLLHAELCVNCVRPLARDTPIASAIVESERHVWCLECAFAELRRQAAATIRLRAPT